MNEERKRGVKMNDIKIEYLPISDLTPYERNQRKHADYDVSQIMVSIQKYGFNDPIGVWSDKNIVVEGHGRLAAAKMLHLKEVPVIRLDHLSDEQRKAYGIIHNKTAELSEWDFDLLIEDIPELDFSGFDIDWDLPSESEPLPDEDDDDEPESDLDPSCQHNVFENQERMQFEGVGFYGIPEMSATHTVGDKMLRFMDNPSTDNLSDYIACFYYDDYKFISAWRDPDKYIEKLREFKAVVSPDFSLYTDFPRALQILSCYRRQWCGAYWQTLGIDVIPDVVWGDRDSFEYCFDGIPKGGTVAVSTVGVKNDKSWNNAEGNMFLDGYNEMLKRLKPETILFYGDMIDGCEGNIIQIPSYYAQRREEWGKK
jgi:hypothetical protein